MQRLHDFPYCCRGSKPSRMETNTEDEGCAPIDTNVSGRAVPRARQQPDSRTAQPRAEQRLKSSPHSQGDKSRQLQSAQPER